LAALWHDLGKYAAEFQAMINSADPEAHLEGVVGGPRQRVNHSSAGALLAVERFGMRFGRLLAYPIAGHHSGLPDWIGEGGRIGLKDRLADKIHLARARAGQPPRDILGASAPSAPIPDGADWGLWVRMLASALFDADFLDAEAFFEPTAAQGRANWPTLSSLLPKLDAHLARKTAKVEPIPVNRLRAEVLQACRAAAARPPGLFSLTVPTGGGKTLSSLAFALEHAQQHGLRRVIYAIPFTSIIEQNAKVFRQAVGSNAVLEHHSALGPRPEAETVRSRLAGENWDAPLVVTTTVQLFESLFASRTSQLRKLHNLAASVLVLDEAQALPPGVLRPVTAVLDQLVRHYRCSVVLCTATQPALGKVFRGFSPQEIVPDPLSLFRALDRVTVDLPPAGERRSWDNLASEIARYPQALAIVNTRRDCRILHGKLPLGAVHLSTWQCAAHRTLLFRQIRRRLTASEELRVVSTSLVEAGVDVDFPAVFRAMSGLDSLAQAAGRCNRNGRLDKGSFVVFRPEEARPWGHIAQAIGAADSALRNHGRPFEPAAFERFFHELYWAIGKEARDKYGIAQLLGLGAEERREGDHLDFRYRKAADAFRMIEDDQETLIVPYDRAAKEAIRLLQLNGPDRHLLRRLQPFTVPVRPAAMSRLREALAVDNAKDLDRAAVLTNEELYRADVGLDLDQLEGPSIDDLIV
jgi:CRISPR-associated endonuclease/helicase Cas3